MTTPLSEATLQIIVQNIKSVKFFNKNIFVSGGSGFFGKWILQTLFYLNKTENANIKITSITRNKSKLSPFLINSYITWIEQDMLNPINIESNFDYIMHLATDVIPRIDCAQLMKEIITGTQNILALSNKNTKILLTSSGAIYGQMPSHPVDENYQGKIDVTNINSFYAEGKRVSEMLALNYLNKKNVNIARCFAFIGKYMSNNFAISSFIDKALQNQDIIINSPNSFRSYMDMIDLTIWLLVMLQSDSNGIYNVGSDDIITMPSLANVVIKATNSKSKIIINEINNQKESRNFYVPDITLAKKTFDLKNTKNINNSIIDMKLAIN